MKERYTVQYDNRGWMILRGHRVIRAERIGHGIIAVGNSEEYNKQRAEAHMRRLAGGMR